MVYVIGDRSLFDAPVERERLAAFVDNLQTIVANAHRFALQSPYKSDIVEAGGLQPDSVVIDSWIDFKVWFSLKNAGHRYLGVRIASGCPEDVY